MNRPKTDLEKLGEALQDFGQLCREAITPFMEAIVSPLERFLSAIGDFLRNLRN